MSGTYPKASGDALRAVDWNIAAAQADDSLKPSGNLAGLASAATARTNLGLGGAAVLEVGTTASTVAAGNDTRITGALQAANNLTDVASVSAARAALAIDGPSTVWAVGTSAGTVAAGDDSRFTTIDGATIGQTTPGVASHTKIAIGPTAAAPGAAPRAFTMSGDQTISGSGGAMFRLGAVLRGTLSANLEGYYAYVVDEDRLGFTDTSQGMITNYMAATLRAGWSGGRTLHQTQLYVGNPASPGTSAEGIGGTSAYQVSGASFAYSYAPAGGMTGAARGNLFGRNDATRVRSGSGYHWNSTFGNETDVGVASDCEVLWKGGIKVVQWADDANRGVIQDYCYGINNQASGTAPGWRIGFALGGFEGWWPFTADSRIMAKIAANVGGGPSLAAASGIDLQGITFGKASFEADGFIVDGYGNAGALTASGVAVQTRSAIIAKTAVVASVTVLEGGLFAGNITLTGSAPQTSGTTATYTVATVAFPYVNSINTAGSGYAVGDTITLVGGTSSETAVGVVTKVFSGGVQGIKMTTPGNYSVVPSSPVSTTTSGAGTGLTLTPQVQILTVTVSNAGTNYSEHLPPTIASAGSLATYRPALFKVSMTATQVQLQLNNGKINVAGIPTSSAGLSTGDLWNDGGTLKIA